ncbi:MAG: AbiH family protein [Candidatus Tenebribacter burtonii]|nr:AbiH family protein [Candidatus Tenebribacter burtonii]
MNKLILIGNGFDLAHGLKTRYSDFLLWYLNYAIQSFRKNGEYADQLIEISFSEYYIENLSIDFTSLSRFKQSLEQYKADIIFKIKSAFFKNLFNITIELNWVDLESEYYSYLKELYLKLEASNFKNFKHIEGRVKSLNNDFDYLKNELHEYLNTIEISDKCQVQDIAIHLEQLLAEICKEKSYILFLNFNYTSTIDIYLKDLKNDHVIVNYIHGKLNNDKNQIIFGYGDEIDDYYQKIENVNNKEYLKNFKSFGYFKTTNYQDFSRFIESNQFEVYIMGHSCGLSDRTLLNRIVEHDNCTKIKIFYHAKSDSENDYIEKTQELSRHFSSKSKHDMRIKIKSFPESSPLVKLNEENA